MLRITFIQDGTSPILRLEGKLLEPLLGELRDACKSAGTTGTPLTLDLAGLAYVDAASTDALRELQEHGAKLKGGSPLINELLKDTN